MTLTATMKKIQFYLTWYKDMPTDERESFTGLWVAERISIFTSLITEATESTGTYSRKVGKYKK